MKKNTRDKSISKLKIKNNRKLYIKVTSIALSIVLLIGAIIYFAFARYESTKDFSLINAKVGVYGDIVIAAVVDGQSQASFPDKSTYKLQNVECKDSNNNTITSMYDTNTWGMYIPEVNGKTKCTYTFTTNTVTEHSLNPTTATGDAYSGSSGNLNGSSSLTTSTPLNLSDYVQNNQYHFNLGGGEQITFPSGFYSSPINVSNGGTSGGNLYTKLIESRKTSGTYATSISNSITIPSGKGILIAIFSLANASMTSQSCTINQGSVIPIHTIQNAGIYGTVYGIYEVNSEENATITASVSHTTTGGGTSAIYLGFYY